jgi:hypothetical protein
LPLYSRAGSIAIRSVTESTTTTTTTTTIIIIIIMSYICELSSEVSKI